MACPKWRCGAVMLWAGPRAKAPMIQLSPSGSLSSEDGVGRVEQCRWALATPPRSAIPASPIQPRPSNHRSNRSGGLSHGEKKKDVEGRPLPAAPCIADGTGRLAAQEMESGMGGNPRAAAPSPTSFRFRAYVSVVGLLPYVPLDLRRRAAAAMGRALGRSRDRSFQLDEWRASPTREFNE